MKTTNRILLAFLVLNLIAVTVTLGIVRSHLAKNELIVSSGNIVSEYREVPSFNSLRVSGNIHLTLSHAETNGMQIHADENLISHVMTEVNDSELKVYSKYRSRRHRPIEIELSYTELQSIDATAGSKISNNDTLSANSLVLKLGAGANSDMQIRTESLELKVFAGSQANLRGFAQFLDLESTAGSQVRAGELQAESAKISASAGSNIEVYVTGNLEANSSSGSNISYAGNPEIKDFKTSSGGNIRSR